MFSKIIAAWQRRERDFYNAVAAAAAFLGRNFKNS